MPMSLANMNTLKMTPKKNFEANRLEAGMLQLTAGTTITLFCMYMQIFTRPPNLNFQYF